MSSRRNFRRRIVLAVTIVRASQEKQLAHTLDLTESTARLGGLHFQLRPGETIEVHRGGARGRFEVIWMGRAGSAMAGQAGVRSLESSRAMWAGLPPDERDAGVDIESVRTGLMAIRSPRVAREKRKSIRHACCGSATVAVPTASFSIHAEIKDISDGGVYLEMSTPLPLNTQVKLKLNVEGVWLEVDGMVRTSYPLVGMALSFQNVTAEARQKISEILVKIQRNAQEQAKKSAQNAPEQSPHGPNYVMKSLALACRTMVQNFENMRNACTAEELEELKNALVQLQQTLSSRSEPDLIDLLAATPRTNRTQ